MNDERGGGDLQRQIERAGLHDLHGGRDEFYGMPPGQRCRLVDREWPAEDGTCVEQLSGRLGHLVQSTVHGMPELRRQPRGVRSGFAC